VASYECTDSEGRGLVMLTEPASAPSFSLANKLMRDSIRKYFSRSDFNALAHWPFTLGISRKSYTDIVESTEKAGGPTWSFMLTTFKRGIRTKTHAL
jgi:hypothetical protein